MNFEKIKEMLKNRKVQIIAGTVAGVLVLTLAGTMILNNKNVENKNIAIEKENKKDVNKEKKDEKEQLEELKKVDTSNLSDEEKKDLENKIVDAEKKVANNENSGLSEEVTFNTSNSTSNSSSNSSSEFSSSSNNGTSISSQSSGSNTNSNPSTGYSSSSSSSSSSQTHTHNWVAITNVVHHEEQGHYEKVLVSEAWTEEVPIYEEREVMICNGCWADLTNLSESDFEDHIFQSGHGSWREEWKQVQVGTNKINHDAVYENKRGVDKAAWDETVTSGYKCSGCGETK